MSHAWLRADRDAVVLDIHVQPGAACTELAGEHGDALKIRLRAPPVDGKANAALLAFIAERLGVAKARVELIAGASSRRKRVRVQGADCAAVAAVLSTSRD